MTPRKNPEDLTVAPSPWNEQRTARLVNLWLDGVSAGRIAADLGQGITRNAVIGKLHRMKLTEAQGEVSRRGAREVNIISARRQQTNVVHPMSGKPIAKEKAPKTVVAKFVAEAMDGPGLADRFNVGPHQCRWPIGDPLADDFTYCGRLAHGSYCPHHLAMAYKPVDAAELKRRRDLNRYGKVA